MKQTRRNPKTIPSQQVGQAASNTLDIECPTDAIDPKLDSNTILKKRSRPFRPSDIDNVSRLMAQMYSESMACAELGISWGSYRSWKCRHKADATIANAIARAQAAQFGAHLANMRDHETGRGGVRRDWRASFALLQLKFPHLFAEAGQQSSGPTINVSVTLESNFEKVMSAVQERMKLVKPGEQKVIESGEPARGGTDK